MSLNQMIINDIDDDQIALEIVRKPKATDNLNVIVKWIGYEGKRISNDFNNFRDHVEYLFTSNLEFQQWIISNSQEFIGISCGIDQSYVSKIFGPAKREHKQKVAALIVEKLDNDVPKADIAEEFEVSVRTIQRVAKDRQTIPKNSLSEQRNQLLHKLEVRCRELKKMNKDGLIQLIVELEKLIPR